MTTGSFDPKALVRDGYDRASRAYRGDDYDLEKSGYGHWLRRLGKRIASGSRVLDLGCGCGVPVARELAKRHAVHGVDLSPVQIERARVLVPAATFTCDDMTSATFEPGRFDAVVALYSIINVPVAEHAGLFRRIASWLEAGGWLLAMVGKHHGSWIEPDFRGVTGVPMYWSHADLASSRRWLAAAGFQIVEEGTEPEKGAPGFAVLVARRSMEPGIAAAAATRSSPAT